MSGHRLFVAAAACRDHLIACGFSAPRGRKSLWLVSVRSSKLSTWTEPVSLSRVGNMPRPSASKSTSSSPSCSPVVSHRSVLCSVPKVALSLACRSSHAQRFDSHLFRVLLLRRLHLPLPLSSRSCRCGLPLKVRGHHRTSCPTSGVLGWRGFKLESAAARVCFEAGARVKTNVFVRVMDLLPQNDASRWLLKVSLSSMVPNSRSTPPSSLPFVQTGLHTTNHYQCCDRYSSS